MSGHLIAMLFVQERTHHYFWTMWKWIEILSDGEPDIKRLNGRLSITFILFLFLAPGGLFAHAYWAVQSADIANFARGGAWLVVISLLAFGLNQNFLSIER
ncbi:MAG: hypothetical protein AAFQ21_09190 [Pseudomonadota bacterium]